jgi:hypothetical protein
LRLSKNSSRLLSFLSDDVCVPLELLHGVPKMDDCGNTNLRSEEDTVAEKKSK